MTPSEPPRRIARTSAVIGLGTLLSRIAGFLRVSALVALGLGPVTDVYNIANSTPNIVTNSSSEGSSLRHSSRCS